MTKISWTDESWNPVTGCTPVSEGCAHCYARTLSKRFGGDFSKVTLHPDRLDKPLHWRKPRMVFVPSMGDLFHEDVPDEFIQQVFTAMAQPIEWGKPERHTFQVLTKRPERMRKFVSRLRWRWGTRMGGPWRMAETRDRPLNPVAALEGIMGDSTPITNIWLGVSVENQARADERIPILLDTPAAVRFVSAEPLLGPLKLGAWLEKKSGIDVWQAPDEAEARRVINLAGLALLDWVIVGGESGGPPERRLVERCWHDDGGFLGEEHHGLQHLGPERVKGSYHWCPKPEALEWVRSIRDQCQAAGVPFFFKQWGPRAGRGALLDGREWREMPR